MELSVQFNTGLEYHFLNHKDHQKILIDVLIRHSGRDIVILAKVLDVSVLELQAVSEGKSFLQEHQAYDLAQLFIAFLAQTFFQQASMVRKYIS